MAVFDECAQLRDESIDFTLFHLYQGAFELDFGGNAGKCLTLVNVLIGCGKIAGATSSAGSEKLNGETSRSDLQAVGQMLAGCFEMSSLVFTLGRAQVIFRPDLPTRRPPGQNDNRQKREPENSSHATACRFALARPGGRYVPFRARARLAEAASARVKFACLKTNQPG
jgi:hypothetical protein